MISLSVKLFLTATSYCFLVNCFVAARTGLSLDASDFRVKSSPYYFG